MKILIIDNYDSFTYNLVYLVRTITGSMPEVKRNNLFELEEVAHFDKIMLSPGPGIPSEAGLMMDLIKAYATQKSILGVCLGHQAIGSFFGGELVNMENVFHGQQTMIRQVANDPIFANVPQEFNAGRYHSWIVNRSNLPSELEVTAEDEQGLIMALRHKQYDLKGVQFHPESIMTNDGEQIIRNWINS